MPQSEDAELRRQSHRREGILQPDYDTWFSREELSLEELCLLLCGVEPRRYEGDAKLPEEVRRRLAAMREQVRDAVENEGHWNVDLTDGTTARFEQTASVLLPPCKRLRTLESEHEYLDSEDWINLRTTTPEALRWACVVKIDLPPEAWAVIKVAWEKGSLTRGEVPTDTQRAVIQSLAEEPLTTDQVCAELWHELKVKLTRRQVERVLAELREIGLVKNRRGLGYFLAWNPPRR